MRDDRSAGETLGTLSQLGVEDAGQCRADEVAESEGGGEQTGDGRLDTEQRMTPTSRHFRQVNS